MNNMILLVLVLMCVIIGCKQYDNNNPNERNPINMNHKKNIPTVDIDTANQLANKSSSPNEIENTDLIISNIDIISKHNIRITYTNKTDTTFNFGLSHSLQLLSNDTWIDVPLLPNVSWKSVGVLLLAGKSYKEDINLKSYYGELESGYYRLRRKMSTHSSKIFVFTEFDIKNVIPK